MLIHTGLLSKLIRRDEPEEPGLLTVILATLVLLAILAGVGIVSIMVIYRTGDLGSGACWALAVSVLGLWALSHANRNITIPLLGEKKSGSGEGGQG